MAKVYKVNMTEAQRSLFQRAPQHPLVDQIVVEEMRRAPPPDKYADERGRKPFGFLR